MRSDEDGELTRNDSTLSRLSQLLNDHDGDRMIAGESGQYEHLRKSKDELKAFTRKQKGLKAYYERQNEILDAYSEVDELLSSSFAKDVLHTFSKQHNGGAGRSRYGALESRGGTPSVRSLSRERGGTGGRGEEEALLGGGMGNGKAGGGGGHKEEQSRSKERRETIMLNVNILVNILLVGSKGAAVLVSNSVSLLASLVDSALDLLSTAIIWGAAVAAGSKEEGGKGRTRYPTGKKRFEPLGVLVFSVFMIASFSQVLVESVQRLYQHDADSEVASLSLFGKATMIATIAIKGVIWFWCGAGDPGPGVGALAQDAKNDVFFNGMSLLFPWLGEQFNVWWLDPAGGLVLSMYIIIEWLRTLHENFVNLSGRMADTDEFCRVLYLVSRFKGIIEISGVEIYHVGEEYIVEVDVILPPQTSLHTAHDIGEVMQTALEALESVSRAYVHLDYSSLNPPQHLSLEEQGAQKRAAARGRGGSGGQGEGSGEGSGNGAVALLGKGKEMLEDVVGMGGGGKS